MSFTLCVEQASYWPSSRVSRVAQSVSLGGSAPPDPPLRSPSDAPAGQFHRPIRHLRKKRHRTHPSGASGASFGCRFLARG
eukprot:14961253-Alexandrium_andersonii.AAC.1